jgi:hypothetical protein
MKNEDVRALRRKLETLEQRMTELIKSGGKKSELAAKLKTDDLGWPLQPNGTVVQRTVETMYDELAARR